MTIERVVWLDAHSGFGGWTAKEDIPKPKDYVSRIDAIGFVISEDDEALILAINRDGSDSSIADWVCIPKGCIKKREVVPSESDHQN